MEGRSELTAERAGRAASAANMARFTLILGAGTRFSVGFGAVWRGGEGLDYSFTEAGKAGRLLVRSERNVCLNLHNRSWFVARSQGKSPTLFAAINLDDQFAGGFI